MTKVEKATLGQRFADSTAAVVRSWAFVLGQIIFIGLWLGLNYFHLIGWDDKAFDGLRLILTIESSFVGSILLMAQHRRSKQDRKIVYSDYLLDCRIYKEVKKIHPLVDELNKRTQERQLSESKSGVPVEQ
jgi:uncharacterized membrane protein